VIRTLVLSAEGGALDLERVWKHTMREAVGDVIGRYLDDDDLAALVPRMLRKFLRDEYGRGKGALAYEAYLRRFAKGFRPSSVVVPHMVAVLESLRAEGWRLGLISRMTRRVLNPAVAAAGLAELFDVVMAEEELPDDTPDPASTLRMTARLGVAVEEAEMVTGDRGWATAAQRAGMPLIRAAWTTFSSPGGGLRSPDELRIRVMNLRR